MPARTGMTRADTARRLAQTQHRCHRQPAQTRRCSAGKGRAGRPGDAWGFFRSYSDARRGASPLRLPACRAGQQCVSPPSCRPGPQSSRSGQCSPEAEQSGQAKKGRRHSCTHTAASSRGDSCVTNSTTGTSGSSATSSLASATMPHEGKAGPCRSGSRAWPWQGFAVLSLANY